MARDRPDERTGATDGRWRRPTRMRNEGEVRRPRDLYSRALLRGCLLMAAARTEHFGALLLRARRADRGLHVLLFFRRRQHRGEAERLDPELTSPAHRVVEVLVF